MYVPIEVRSSDECSPLPKYLRHRASVSERHGPPHGVADFGGGVDAERPEHGGGNVFELCGVFRRIGAAAVAGAPDRSAAEAAASHHHRVTVRPMRAALGIAVADL